MSLWFIKFAKLFLFHQISYIPTKVFKTEIALITIKCIFQNFSNSIYLFLFRILKIESEFFKHVDLSQASLKLGLEMDVVDLLFRFWILKRRSQANRPLFIPRMTDDTEAGLTVSLSLSNYYRRSLVLLAGYLYLKGS